MNTLETLYRAARILTQFRVKAIKVNTDRLTFQVWDPEYGHDAYIILDALRDESLDAPILVAEIVTPPGWDPEEKWICL